MKLSLLYKQCWFSFLSVKHQLHEFHLTGIFFPTDVAHSDDKQQEVNNFVLFSSSFFSHFSLHRDYVLSMFLSLLLFF